MPRLAPTLLLGVVSLLASSPGAAAPADSAASHALIQPFDGGPRPTLAARRAEGIVRVDGRLDEPDWSLAEVASDLRRMEIREGEAPSESTWVRVLFDEDRVVFGVRCANRTPGAIRSSLAPRDQNTDDDLVAIHLDTYLDRRRAYIFGVNAHGVQLDGILVGGEPDFTWDAVWEAEATRDESGWTAEIAVPFRAMRFPLDGAGTWGLWVRRQITKHDEIATWPLFRLGVRGDIMGQAGDLTGLIGARGAGRLDVQPYVTATREEWRDPGAPDASWHDDDDVEMGADARFAVTSTLNLNATFNPDFSQVEADALQIDRNQRFALFYPEKRPFFVEGGEIFNVGFELPYHLVYTRRIVDPEGGAKLTGQVGRVRVGAIAAWDRGGGSLAGTGAGDEDGVSGEAVVGIARATVDIGEHSDAGLLVTNRTGLDPCDECLSSGATFEGSSNTVVAGDTRIRLSRTLSFYGVGAYSHAAVDSAGPPWSTELSDLFYSVFLFYNDGTRETGIYDDYLGPEYRNESGFTERVDFRQTGGFANWTVRPRHSWLRTWEPYVDAFTAHDSRGALTEWSANQGVRFGFHGQTSLRPAYICRYQTWLGESFDLDQVAIGFTNTRLRAMAIDLSMTFGDDVIYGESAEETRKVWAEHYALAGTLRPSSRLTGLLEVRRDRTAPAFAEGEIYDVWVMGLKMTYQFTRRLYARVYPQYDTDAEHLDTDALLGYVLHPGSVVYLGVNGDYDRVDDRTEASRRSVFLKMSYLFQP